MTRAIIAGAGAIVALGFLFASAVANYLFGASLGRAPWEAALYGAVGVLAVGPSLRPEQLLSMAGHPAGPVPADRSKIKLLACRDFQVRKRRKSDNRHGMSKDAPIVRFPLDSQAWHEGYLVGRRGTEVAFNPYDFGTPEARAWIVGLSAGKMKPLRLVS